MVFIRVLQEFIQEEAMKDIHSTVAHKRAPSNNEKHCDLICPVFYKEKEKLKSIDLGLRFICTKVFNIWLFSLGHLAGISARCQDNQKNTDHLAPKRPAHSIHSML